MRLKDIELCYEMTGLNILSLLESDGINDLQRINPKLYQWLVWWERHKTNPEVKFEDIASENLDLREVRKAIQDFFISDKQIKKE